MRKEKMTTSDANSLTEAKANLALNDLNRRERLLKIVRGEPTWKTYAWSGAMWLIFFVYIYNTGPINPVILLSALAVILSFYVVFLIEGWMPSLNSSEKITSEKTRRMETTPITAADP